MEEFMLEAINLAKKAKLNDEVPVGAVIVKDGKIIAKAFNCREKKNSALAHAEIIAIKKACRKLKSWRLDDCDIYVTLEPCPMCAGAIANARIKTLYYGCDERSGNDNLCQNILSSNRLNHKTQIVKLNFQNEISSLLTDFFKSKRSKN